jgi:hypothetical protein
MFWQQPWKTVVVVLEPQERHSPVPSRGSGEEERAVERERETARRRSCVWQECIVG